MTTAIQVRINRRSKHIYLRLSPQGEVLLTSPRRLSQRETQQIVAEHRLWLEQQQHKLDLEQQRNPQRWQFPPAEIGFPGLQQLYQLKQNTPLWIVHQLERPAEKIFRPRDEQHFKKLLQQWLKAKAKDYLGKRLAHLSQTHLLSYEGLKIRKMKSRWGSCSAEKVICLNQNLLFLQPHLIDYVIRHELAHTIHFDHSAKFWKLVKQMDGNYKQHDKEMNEQQGVVPLWALD